MGKTARWFRGLLGGKKDCPRSSSSPGGSDGKPPTKEKRRWSFVVRSSTKDRESTTTTTAAPATGVDQRRGSYREGWGSCSSASSCGGYNLAGDPNIVVDPNKHAIAVAAATAAVAEAAVAAAQAAAAVVKLTSSSGRCATAAPAYVSGNCGLINNNNNNSYGVEDWAAVKIQSAFRGYLARRALRALKGLVKLQALVRGHIMRKKTADTMRCMQALVRVQARARAGRFKTSGRRHLNKQLSQSHLPGPPTPEKYEYAIRSNSTRYDHTSSLKRNGSKQNSRDIYELDRVNSSRTYADHRIRNGPLDDEKGDKVLEIDPGKPQFDHRRGNLSQSSQHALMQDQISHSYTTMDSPSKDSTTAQLSTSSPSSGEVQSIRHPRRFPVEIDNDAFSTAENSPHYYSASSSRRGPFTPTKSECSRSIYSGYSDHPNYMANTESSRAKVRSQSAPKQRLEFDKCSSMKRYTGFGFNDTRLSAHKMTNSASTSTLHANFTRKAYPGSGRLDRLGMPIHSDFAGFNGINPNRY